MFVKEGFQLTGCTFPRGGILVFRAGQWTMTPNSTHKTARLQSVAILAGLLVLAGCQSTRIDSLSTQPAPAPLPAAPAGTVQQGTLPPATGAPGVSQPGAFPQAPATPGAVTSQPAPVTPAPGTQVAGATPSAGGAPVSKDTLVGAWKVTTAGSSCQMFMALTQWSGGFRAASRGCPGEAASVSAWDVAGSQVVLKDSNGNTVARLFSSGAGRFDGTTNGGAAISLSR
jgi:Protease inhibitor Inh